MQSYSQRPVNRLSCVGAVEFPFERFSAFTIWNFAQHCWNVDNLSFFNICEMLLTRQRVVCFWREVAGRTVDMVFICLSLMFVNALWLSFRKVQTQAVSREQGNGGRMWIFSLHLIQGQTVCRTLKMEGFIPAEIERGRGSCYSIYLQLLQTRHLGHFVFEDTNSPLCGHIDTFF